MSHALLIRNGILERLKRQDFFKGFKRFGITSSRQVQPEDLPYMAVYFLGETLNAEGNANHGEPNFVHDCDYGVSVIMALSDEEEHEEMLDDAFDAVLGYTTGVLGLLTDPTCFKNPAFVVEGITKITRKNDFGMLGANNETPVGELKLGLTLQFRTDWPPLVVDDFTTMHVETRYPHADTDPAEVQQVVQQYDIDQG